MSDRDLVHPLEILNPKVRARFPMIDRDSREPRLYLNTGAGSLTVDTASEAAFDAQRRLNPMPGAVVAGEAETAALHARVRDLIADFLNARSGREISFHQSSNRSPLRPGLRAARSPRTVREPRRYRSRPHGQRLALGNCLR